MNIALVALLTTLLTGGVVLGLWLEPARAQTDRRSTALGLLHVATALTAVSFWIVVLVIGQSRTTALLSSSLLAATVLLGVSTLVSSRSRERQAADGGAEPVAKPALVVHAITAAIAVALCALAIITR